MSTGSHDSQLYWFYEVDKQELEVENLRSCHLGKLFFFSVGRNAYYRYWSETYMGKRSFYLSFEDAKHRSELDRVQGSQFTILEIPVLVFTGPTRSLLVTEINSPTPLAQYVPVRRKLLTLRDVGFYFYPPAPDSVVQLLTGKQVVLPASLPFLEHHSSSSGGAYYLNWHQCHSTQHIDSVLRVVSQVTKRLQRG